VTGGTGVVGKAAVTELVRQGHTVRPLSRNAAEDVRRRPQGGGGWPASVFDQNQFLGCAERCDLVLHVVGVMEAPLRRLRTRV